MEHLDGVVNQPNGQMTDEELQFHYFKLHDYDNNNMLDGIELRSAMTHFHKGMYSSSSKFYLLSPLLLLLNQRCQFSGSQNPDFFYRKIIIKHVNIHL